MFVREKLPFNHVEVHLLYYEDFDVNEYLHNLREEEQRQIQNYSSTSRKMEYTATRVLRSMLFGNDPIQYDSNGAPFILSEGYISISHAKHVVGIAFCKEFPIGFDLEPIDAKVLRVCHKFLNEKEVELFDVSKVEDMIRVWSAKEALYKISGRKGLIFSKDLLVDPLEEDLWLGRFRGTNEIKSVHLKSKVHSNFVVSVTIDEPFNE